MGQVPLIHSPLQIVKNYRENGTPALKFATLNSDTPSQVRLPKKIEEF